MKNTLAQIFFIILAISANAQVEVIDKVVGTIGGEYILLSEVQEQKKLIESQQGFIDENAECMILDNVLAQKLLLNQSKLDSIMVSDDEIETQLDARFERILAYMNNDVSQFESYYGQTMAEVRNQFREDLKSQILVERMQGQIMSNVKITPSEVKAFYKTIPKDSLPYFNSEVEIGEIVRSPKVNKVEKLRALTTITEIRAKIMAGEKFEELAAIHSADPGSGRNGGDLGWAKRGTYVPEFEAAVYTLEPNEISEPIETEFGYHIIQLLERRGNTVHARHILIKPNITDADRALAKQELDSIRNIIISDSLNWSMVIKQFSDKKSSNYNNNGNLRNPKTGDVYFEIGDLDPDMYFTIDTMQVNDISAPLEFTTQSGEISYRIIKLKSRTNPHKANLQEDYSKIQKAALESKKNIYINKWVEDKVKSTFVKIDPMFQSCEIVKKWVKE